MPLLNALAIAVLQGVTELFPISSLGHAVVLPPLFGIAVDQHAPDFLPFLVILHLGTAAALLLYFRRDWLELILAALGQGPRAERKATLRLLFLLVLGTVPAAVLGYALNHALRALFAAPVIAAAFLIVNGVVLFLGERLRHRAGEGGLEAMHGRSALLIGAAQALALIPGISRSGMTMVGGLLSGLSHEAAARFSFLLATPVILGAGLLEVPKLFHAGAGAAVPAGTLAVYGVAGVVAGVTAYASVALLMRWFRQHEVHAMRPFAYYCWLVGAAALLVLR